MKLACAVVALSLIAISAAEAKITTAESDRLHDAAAVLRSLRLAPDRDIPQNVWDRAACVAVIPAVKKAAFIFGGESGRGVMACKIGRGWSAPAFLQLEKGSWGFQIGAEETDLVLMIMNSRGADKLLSDKVSLGAGASVAAGPVGRSASAATDLQLSAEILSYSRSQGVFAGIDLSGGVLGPDNDANHDVYGPAVDAKQIVANGSLNPPASADSFMAAIRNEFGPIATSGHR
jgi:lipid-binding SYLF domain-containing protein